MGKKNAPKRPLNKFVRLSGIGLQIGITIYLAAYFGKKLDAHYLNEKKIITLTLVLIAFIASMYSLLVQLKKIQDKEKNE